MPELPEVTALAAFLDERLAGATIDRVQIGAVHALKTADPPYTSLVGRRVESVGRRGKFIVVITVPDSGRAGSASEGEADDGGPVAVVVHLALGGWIRVLDRLPEPTPPRGKGYVAARFGFVRDDGDEAGIELTEAGTWKRLSLHIVRRLQDVPAVAELGPEPLDDSFTLEAFRKVLNRKKQVKGLLRDQKLIAGIGNAYSDEILHAAKVSPFAIASTLGDETTARLYDAMRTVLGDAVAEDMGHPPEELKDEKRRIMRVHRRAGEACPVCGDTILEVSFADSALQYCPTCQTGGRPLADRRTSKFLK
ncbi:Fpg/Nei family DNA glycosylase [Sinomonas notoginsengisoli]|uniref:Fpg/Nei family DNA glycosylase n=1 Tax=Sinomonas notoginsengisoli TaxID=1457311 RepID=UPI001F3C2DC8|nr:DNA-formamidopyrimidine glycosylase family protein [Sinomonas notoginsengisoli]